MRTQIPKTDLSPAVSLKAVVIGKVSALTPSCPERPHTRLFSACSLLVFKPVPSTTSTSRSFFLATIQSVADSNNRSEQEHKRTQESSNVDDRTQHEIYAHPFMRAVQAGVASVMCSYSTYTYLSMRNYRLAFH